VTVPVLILCGGRGSRLHEYTETRPKPMVEVGGKPILWHVMKLYAHHGMRNFILCLGHKGDVIKRYFLDYEAMNTDFTVRLGQSSSPITYHGSFHDEDGWTVTLVDTGEEVMTGTRIERASRCLRPDVSTFAVSYGDGVSDVDLTEVLSFHRSHGKLATVTGVRPTSRFGELHIDGTRVVSFSEKPRIDHAYISGGFFFFERAFLNQLTPKDGCMLEREPLDRCAADGQLEVFAHHGYWQCMDTYRDWEVLEREWTSGRAPWKVWK
jgi:glucose-1-phosphate cytidylyltransferase